MPGSWGKEGREAVLTLGIHDGHTATACIMEDGRVLACVSEERLNRAKEWEGFPEGSIRACLEIAGKSPGEFDAVGLCSLMPTIGQRGYHRPSWPKKIFGYGARVLPGRLLQREANIALVQSAGRLVSGGRKRHCREGLRRLGFNCPMRVYEHHLLHAATAYYTNARRPDPCLVMTLDGSGDGVSGTVQIGEGGELRRLAGIFNYNSICEFYTRVTQHLGMKPMSHEYKVMGMAPYADEKQKNELLEVFNSYFAIPDGRPLQMVNTSGRWKWQYQGLLESAIGGRRFDIVCGAVQGLFEDRVLKWVENAVRETGIHDLALSGGGFMNIKLNGKILDMPEVDSLFIFPSCGDESNPIGAAVMAALERGYNYRDIHPLETVYWGPEFGDGDIRAVIDGLVPDDGFKIFRPEDIDRFVGEKVAEGKIIGRMTGRMEWGARALGNRSIVADPRSISVIQRINQVIKRRDFWMPFAPAVLDTYRDAYLKLRDAFDSSFMTIGCRTTERARGEMPAALHPHDRTARPQVVIRERNPSFYRMIESFEARTGIGGVLNTSFNIHGEPIVCTPKDAVSTLMRSDLDAVQVEDFYIERQR